MYAKPLRTAITGSRACRTKIATVELHIQGNTICSTFHVSNHTDWDSTSWQSLLTALNVIMNVRNNNVAMQPTGKSTHPLHMLQKQLRAVSTAACSICTYDDDIFHDSSSHVCETHSEDAEAEFARYLDESAQHIQSYICCLHVM